MNRIPSGGAALLPRRLEAVFDTPFEILLWLALFAATAAVSFSISYSVGDLHNDVLEAYALGQELQFGYDKHPPFWGWVAYAWFSVFPRTAL